MCCDVLCVCLCRFKRIVYMYAVVRMMCVCWLCMYCGVVVVCLCRCLHILQIVCLYNR